MDYTGIVEASAVLPAIIVSMVFAIRSSGLIGQKMLQKLVLITTALFFLTIILGVIQTWFALVTLAMALSCLLFTMYKSSSRFFEGHTYQS